MLTNRSHNFDTHTLKCAICGCSQELTRGDRTCAGEGRREPITVDQLPLITHNIFMDPVQISVGQYQLTITPVLMNAEYMFTLKWRVVPHRLTHFTYAAYVYERDYPKVIQELTSLMLLDALPENWQPSITTQP